MAELRDIVVDCARPSALARFWAAALDGYAVAPYDDAEVARLAALGIHDLEDDPTVLVIGPGPRLFFQLVPEGKVGQEPAAPGPDGGRSGNGDRAADRAGRERPDPLRAARDPR